MCQEVRLLRRTCKDRIAVACETAGDQFCRFASARRASCKKHKTPRIQARHRRWRCEANPCPPVQASPPTLADSWHASHALVYGIEPRCGGGNRRKRDEASHMNEVLIRPDEYQARPRHMPPIFLSTLAVLLLAFGGILTIALPWNILDLANGREFQDLSRFQYFVWDMFAVFSFVMLLRWCTVQFLAFRAQLSKTTTQSYDSSAWPSVSILVPAYQEAENIEATLRSLAEHEYPRYEIIVVDDGSSDETFEKAHKFSGKSGSGTVAVLRKDNGGKWSALNLAFKHAKYEFILCVDADSRLSRDALQLLVPHMRNPRIAAVCGQVTVRNRVIENRAKSPWFGDGRTRSDRTLPEIEFGTDSQIGRQDRGACQTGTHCRPNVGRDVCRRFSAIPNHACPQRPLCLRAEGDRVYSSTREYSVFDQSAISLGARHHAGHKYL